MHSKMSHLQLTAEICLVFVDDQKTDLTNEGDAIVQTWIGMY
jgi:hypothetical protein